MKRKRLYIALAGLFVLILIIISILGVIHVKIFHRTSPPQIVDQKLNNQINQMFVNNSKELTTNLPTNHLEIKKGHTEIVNETITNVNNISKVYFCKFKSQNSCNNTIFNPTQNLCS